MSRTSQSTRAALLAFGLLAGARPVHGQYFTLTDLGTLGASSRALGVSETGAVAGSWFDDEGGEHAFLWTPQNGMQDLGDLGGGWARAVAVNSSGQVVGVSATDAPADHAFLWDAESGMIDLGTLGGQTSAAADINNDAVVVGASKQGDGQQRAFRWTSGGGMKSLGTLNQGQSSEARGLNAGGAVVGISIKNGEYDPFIWTAGGGMVALQGVKLMYGATEISDAGTVSGAGTDPGPHERSAYRWSPAQGEIMLSRQYGNPAPHATDMYTVEGLAINSAGLVVGWGEDAAENEQAYVWEPRYRTLNLNSAIPPGSGWSLSRATDINDAGQIVGFGVAPDGNEHAFLLTARPVQPVIFVKQGDGYTGDGLSWQTAYTRLGDALLAAALGTGVEQVWVAQGAYTPDLPSWVPAQRTRKFLLPEDLSLFGGFAGSEESLDERDWAAHPTILDGDLAGDDQPGFVNTGENAYSVVQAIVYGEGHSARLDGFTVRAGNASDFPTYSRGGGLFALHAELDVAHCLFEANFADKGGGAWAGDGVYRLTDCEFSGNAAYNTGGAYVENGGRISGCRFLDNEAINEGAGGLFADTSSPVRKIMIDHCLFQGNLARSGPGGLEAPSNNSNCAVFNCRFIANTAGQWFAGGAHLGGDMDIANCLFLGNRAAEGGGGLAVFGGMVPPRLVNCTIAYNSIDGEIGAGVNLANGPVTISNCILWGNEAVAIPSQAVQIGGNGSAQINYSAVQFWDGALGGQGNAGDNPKFVDIFGDDGVKGTGDEELSLTINSPYLDAADNTAVPLDAPDLDGDGKLFEPLPRDLAENDRFVAIPGVPPKGKGKAPFADLGPFELPSPSCPPDFDDSGVLDLFDFLAFVNLFNAHDPRADIDGNGAFDLFDFLGFVNLFNAGC